MKSIYLNICAKCVVFALLGIMLYAPAVWSKDLQLSMLPRYFPKRLTRMITPLAQYLAKETGYTIKPVLTDNFDQYEEHIRQGKIQIGYENPLIYSRVASVHRVIAMALKGQGGDKFRGIVITRPDSGIRGLADLRGHRIMIVSKTSAGGYLSQKLTLAEEGIQVDTDCDLHVAADNRQENVILSVSLGDADAGFIRESALHKADKYIRPGSIEVIGTTAWLPNWALSVNRTMDPGLRQAIQQALLKLVTGDPVLKAMGLSGFRAASDEDYAIMRKLVAPASGGNMAQ